MMHISEKDALQKIVGLLAEWLRVSKNEIRKKNPPHNKNVDGYFKVGNYEFVVEIKAGSNSAQVSSAIQTLKKNRIQSRRGDYHAKAYPEERADPGNQHRWASGAGSGRGHGYYRADIQPAWDGPPADKCYHRQRPPAGQRSDIHFCVRPDGNQLDD